MFNSQWTCFSLQMWMNFFITVQYGVRSKRHWHQRCSSFSFAHILQAQGVNGLTTCACDFYFETCLLPQVRVLLGQASFQEVLPFPYLIFFHDKKGFENLMFLLWFTFLGGSSSSWTGPSIYSLYSPFFGCFDLLMFGKVSSIISFLELGCCDTYENFQHQKNCSYQFGKG